MRRISIVAGLALLGACNMVVTKAPLFTAGAAGGAGQLKPGVWDEKPERPCDFDPAGPVADWPSCAKGFIVENGRVVAPDHDASGKQTWTSTDLVVSGGKPPILQINLRDIDLKGLGDLKLPTAMYLYLALRPEQTDAAGRITAYTAWPVLCGPPPPGDAKGPDGASQRMGTLKPLPGLTMDDKANNCTPATPDALRAAGLASEKWATAGTMTVDRWIRDGER